MMKPAVRDFIFIFIFFVTVSEFVFEVFCAGIKYKLYL